MGLYIHSLGELPAEARRAYYVYLLDYGWDEPLGEAMRRNFLSMAEAASRSNAVVIQGLRGTHFEDEVLSWHHINGEPSEDILPAILVTTRHPATIHEFSHSAPGPLAIARDALLLIPLKKMCKAPQDVADVISRIFTDIRNKKALADFRVAKEMRSGVGGALVDALILEPNISGLGIDLKALSRLFKRGSS